MKRIQKTRNVRDTVLIITNGKQTENNYFNGITSVFQSMYTIKVAYLHAECDELVRHACSLDPNEYNQIWVVFDIDDSYTEGHLLCALNEARANDIKIAYSNEAFEVWLLFHLTDTVSSALSRKAYIKVINEQLQRSRVINNYEKNDEKLLRKIFIPKIPNAVANAKKAYQKKQAEHQKQYIGNKNYPIWEWRSTSTVYQLIEALKLTKKRRNSLKK